MSCVGAVSCAGVPGLPPSQLPGEKAKFMTRVWEGLSAAHSLRSVVAHVAPLLTRGRVQQPFLAAGSAWPFHCCYHVNIPRFNISA